MKPEICFMITTFNRSASCRALVESIAPFGDVYIINDGSAHDYNWALKYNYRFKPHGGKELYWQTVSELWQMVPHDYKYYIMLPDDMLPVANFTERAINAWNQITDTTKICLNLYTDKSRLTLPCWTNKPPEVHQCGRKIQWVDMAFVVERRFFDILNWKIKPIEANWNEKPQLSSGVGAQISRKFDRLQHSLWQTHTSLLIPQPATQTSVMNTWRNGKNDPINKCVSGEIIAQIASVPQRVNLLRQTVESLRPQVDKIFVALNNYTFTPDFLNEGEYIHLDNSTGDAAKFYNVEKWNGYFFSCDDDLIYPPAYVQTMITAIHKYSAIVSHHGKKYPRPFTSFYNLLINVRCLDNCCSDVFVDMPGTGVMAFHTGMFKINYSDFKLPNMADVWVCVKAIQQKVNIVALAHTETYLTYLNPADTIYQTQKTKHKKPTATKPKPPSSPPHSIKN